MTTASTPSTPRRGGGIRWDQLVWGGGLLVFGVAWFVDVAARVSVPYAVVAAATLIAVGLALPLAPPGDRGGVFGLGLVLTVVVLAGTIIGPAVDPTVVGRGIGGFEVRPADATQLRERYEHGVGDVEIDLRAVRVATPTAVAADLGVGDLVVRVPAETAIEVDGDVGIGEIVVFGDQRGGVGVTVHRRDGPSSETRVLRLDTSVGIGRVEVTR